MSRSQTNEQPVTLMESGTLTMDKAVDSGASSGESRRVEVHRGMTVLTGEGHTAGRLAAVVLNRDQQIVTHCLVMRQRQLLEYRLVPVELIEQVGDEEVLLRILEPVMESLPIWHGS
jgi:sporulation protein YlmC with PRC-barrel domain